MSLYPKEGNSDWFPREVPKPHPIIPAHEPIPPVKKVRSCNRHDDCDLAQEKAKKAGAQEKFPGVYSECCSSDDCDDCLPK